MPSLLPFQPEKALHGVDIQLQVVDTNGLLVTIGEAYDITWTEDQHMVDIHPLGTRLKGQRQGAYSCVGSFTGYKLNGAITTMLQGYGIPAAAGVTSSIYHDQRGFRRYQIQINWNGQGQTTGPTIFYNVTLSKDVLKANADKQIDDTVDFSAETVFGN